MATKHRVYIPQDTVQTGKDYLLQHGCELLVGHAGNEREVVEAISQCHALLLRGMEITDAVLRSATKLKVVARSGSGYNNINVDLATQLGIRVAYAPFGGGPSVPEHTMHLLLACAKNASYINQEFCQKGDFEARNRLFASEISGKTLGLIGLGRIGSQVAAMAHFGFGMKILAHDPFVDAEAVPEYVNLLTLDDVFIQSDAVSLHLPSLPETQGVVDFDKLALMKKDALLVNAARGEVINEADLIAALERGVIRGAGLDVYSVEPPGADNKLLRMPNVVATPHYASITADAMNRLSLQAAEAIVAVLEGREPEWPLNSL